MKNHVCNERMFDDLQLIYFRKDLETFLTHFPTLMLKSSLIWTQNVSKEGYEQWLKYEK